VIGKDATGRELALGRAPRRIVSLIPSVTETLFALGLDAAIVGVTVYCVEPRAGVARKTKVGGEKNPKLELIRELTPDLVIANVEENLKADVDRLREWGIPVWVTYPRTVAEGIGMVRELGELTATRPRAAAIADELEALLAEVRARTAGRPPVPVFYPIWRAPYMTINADTYVHDMLAVCGGRNVFGDRPERYPTISLEEVRAARPDVIVLPDEPFRFRATHVQDFAPYPDIPAVAGGRIHLMDGKLFCWYGPRIGDALRALPEIFAGATGGSAAPRR
jgi:ABC-type Fe3+-hydroxamate transport system substrate-binding protein